jgi:hypothetical protein
VKLADLHTGDQVEVNIRGRRFKATVTGAPERGRIPIRPLARGVGYFSASARQVRRVLRDSAHQMLLGGEL